MVIAMKSFTTIYLFECKKILNKRIVWAAAAVMLVLEIAANVCSLLISYRYTDADGNIAYRTGYEEEMGIKEAAQAITGRKIDESLLNEMKEAYADMRNTEETIKDRWTYQEVFNYVINYAGYEEVLAVDEKSLYQIRRDALEEENQYWELSEEEIRYWEEQESTIEKPFVYEYKSGACLFFARLILLTCLWLAFIAIGLANFFGEEHTRRTDQLILCSKNGKTPLYLAKIAAGVTFGMGATVFFYLVQLALIAAIYGMSGFALPLQLYLWMSALPISLGGAILISFVLSLAASVLCSVFTMLLSELFRNGVAALSVVSGATLFTVFVSVPVRYGIVSQLYTLMPMRFFNDTAFLDKRLFSIFGKHFTILQTAPVFYLAAAVVLAGIGYRVYRGYQVQGR
ncbi:MAG: ABC transporter permease [Bacillus sp. (in: Bacteria)]|nr:ABC transporter permease [Bacillus sp. (in: firmicutes)]MCM1427635.1 ABC transporter permease [Eubacterium sp.]